MIKQSFSDFIDIDIDIDDDDDDENEEENTTLHGFTIKGGLLIWSPHLGAACFTPMLPVRSVSMKFLKLQYIY